MRGFHPLRRASASAAVSLEQLGPVNRDTGRLLEPPEGAPHVSGPFLLWIATGSFAWDPTS